MKNKLDFSSKNQNILVLHSLTKPKQAKNNIIKQLSPECLGTVYYCNTRFITTQLARYPWIFNLIIFYKTDISDYYKFMINLKAQLGVKNIDRCPILTIPK